MGEELLRDRKEMEEWERAFKRPKRKGRSCLPYVKLNEPIAIRKSGTCFITIEVVYLCYLRVLTSKTQCQIGNQKTQSTDM